MQNCPAPVQETVVFITQIKVYSFSEPGRKPEKWDPSQKGTVEINEIDYDDEDNFIASLDEGLTFITESQVAWLGVAGYYNDCIPVTGTSNSKVFPRSSRPDSIQSNPTGISKCVLGLCSGL